MSNVCTHNIPEISNSCPLSVLLNYSYSMQGFSFDMVCIVGPEEGFQQNGEIGIRKFCIFCKKIVFAKNFAFFALRS